MLMFPLLDVAWKNRSCERKSEDEKFIKELISH